ncbi:MAG: hypothetical protein UIC63_00460 [Bacteroidaceae bacterium]|nr:hypothetical protein [Bacteroidaceae bacterium]
MRRFVMAAAVVAVMGCRQARTVENWQRTESLAVAGSREALHRWDMDSLLARMSVCMDSMTVAILPPDTLQPTVVIRARRSVVRAEAERTVQSVQTVVKVDTATVVAVSESEAKDEREPRMPRWLFVTICVLAASLLIHLPELIRLFIDAKRK